MTKLSRHVIYIDGKGKRFEALLLDEVVSTVIPMNLCYVTKLGNMVLTSAGFAARKLKKNHWSKTIGFFLLLAFNLYADETNLVAKVVSSERNEVELEIPQPNGLETKVISRIYVDRVITVTNGTEIISATNTVKTDRATIKLVPTDERRLH
jgi:hypothetical protein